MADQAWLSAESASGQFGSPPPPPPPPSAKAAYELRPLTTGELLDRTFYLYRSNFWLFVGLAAIASTVRTAVALVQIIYLHYVTPQGAGNPARQVPGTAGLVFQTLGVFAFTMVASVLYLAVYGVIQAAITSAVTSIYLGESTSMKKALNAVKGRWLRFIGIGLWQMGSAMWLFLVLVTGGTFAAAFLAVVMRGNSAVVVLVGVLFGVLTVGGFVYGVIAYIRNSFAVPAAVMEDLKVRKAMRRSKNLTAGTKGRIFLLYVFAMALYFVALAIQSPLTIMILEKKTTQILLFQSISLFVEFFSGSVIGPVAAVGLCLFYIDQRIRKEGFDIEFLIEHAGPVNSVPPPPMPEIPALITELTAEPVVHSVVENP